MKTLYFYVLSLTITLAGCFGSPPPLPSAEHFYFVAEGIKGDDRQGHLEQFARLYTEGAAPGEYIHLISTPSHQLIASIKVPNGDKNARLRDPEAASDLKRIRDYFDPERTGSSLQIDLPQVASRVTEFRQTRFPSLVTLAGDPCYVSTQHAGFSMTDFMVPTDGSIKSPMGPFSAGAENFPPSTKVNWVAHSGNWGSDSIHRSAAIRWLRLFFQTYDSQLCRLTSDSNNAFLFDPSQFEGEIIPRSDGVGVWNTKRGSERRAVTSGPDPAVVVIGNGGRLDAEAVNRLLADAEQNPDKIVLAINWESADPNCDIDMHVIDTSLNEEMYFGKKETRFGQLFRDVRQAGDSQDDADFIGKWEAALITHDRLNDLKLWLHTYGSKSPSMVRVIAIWKGKRREAMIEMPRSPEEQELRKRTVATGWKRVGLGGKNSQMAATY